MKYLSYEADPFFWKCAKFCVDCENAIEIRESGFRFSDNSVLTSWWTFPHVWEEYMWSPANVLPKSHILSVLTNRDVFWLNFSWIKVKYRIKVLPCRFQQCLPSVNTLTREWCCKTGAFRHSRKNIFWSQ